MFDSDYLGILENTHRERCGTDRLFCYTASHIDDSASIWRLSIVEEDEPGHFPVSEDAVGVGSMKEMLALADTLNRTRLGLIPTQTVAIVASSMSGDVERNRRRR